VISPSARNGPEQRPSFGHRSVSFRLALFLQALGGRNDLVVYDKFNRGHDGNQCRTGSELATTSFGDGLFSCPFAADNGSPLFSSGLSLMDWYLLTTLPVIVAETLGGSSTAVTFTVQYSRLGSSGLSYPPP